MKHLDCETARERLSEYLDEALTGRDMQRMAGHLEACEACHRAFDELRVTKAVLQREAVPPPAPDFWVRVYAHVRRQSASLPAPHVSLSAWLRRLVRQWTRPRWVSAGVVVAAILLIAFLWRPWGPPGLAEDADLFIAQHAYYSAIHPLSDWSRLAFIHSEMNAPQGRWVSFEGRELEVNPVR